MSRIAETLICHGPDENHPTKTETENGSRIRLDQNLPPSLSQRCQWSTGTATVHHGPGEFVLYWMHNASRAHENPALDVAITLARQNGLPLLIYHGLSEKYPYASDRHHAFILQGVREVQREFAEMGIEYAFHLERDGCRGPHLRDLTRRAAVMVTETMPVAPLVQWGERLRSITTTPIVYVDTTCLLPLSEVGRFVSGSAEDCLATGFDAEAIAAQVSQASRYRDLTATAYQERIDRDYDWDPNSASQTQQETDVDKNLPERFVGSLGFEPLDLQDVCLAGLIGRCRIDHSIAPVTDSPGGSRAGYERWETFRQSGLAEYDRRRHNAADLMGGCRLSAYLHYGMISPFRIAREASRTATELPTDRPVRKFLDEFLVWREMSFHFCQLHHDKLESLDACPQWAIQSLREHAGDFREVATSWETLARGKTAEPLWNAAQRSLLRHGELHNDLRMTWGKAFLKMAESPEQSLCYLIDLNHRYALDGRSASSYGGILWCFGQFDRPFENKTPVNGVVRSRTVEEHTKRLPVTRFSKRSDRPIAANLPRVAVIGAGIGGLMAARTIADHGLDVCVFDKSRGVGGRLATRRNDDAASFDHGAQYFTVRDDLFARHVRSWISEGVTAAWMGRIVELRSGGEIVSEKRSRVRYVGTPGMNSIAKHLAQDLNVELGRSVSRLVALNDADDGGWELLDSNDQSCGRFDAVISNCPPPQSASLLDGHTDLTNRIASVGMIPCWTLMLQCEGLADLPYVGAFVNEGPLSWISRNDAKPGRTHASDESKSASSAWVLHAGAEWSKQHLEDDREIVREHLMGAMEQIIGRKIGDVQHAFTHRWRYANTSSPLPERCLWDHTSMIGACGDWCGGPRVEGAFLSGAAVAGALLRHVTIDRPAIPVARPAVQQTLL